MKLYAHKVSTACRPVLQFIAENNVAAEIIPVDLMKGEHMNESFARINPNRCIPVLDDDGLMLTESSAILKYLAEKIGSTAYPKTLRERARVNMLMDWFNTGFYADYGYRTVYPQLFEHLMLKPAEANLAMIESGAARSRNWLAVLDSHWLVPGRRWLVGDAITIADYFGASITWLGTLVGVSFERYPNIRHWLAAVQSRPGWGDTYDVFDGFAASLQGKTFITP
jgi:glutathione S-transferase